MENQKKRLGWKAAVAVAMAIILIAALYALGHWLAERLTISEFARFVIWMTALLTLAAWVVVNEIVSKKIIKKMNKMQAQNVVDMMLERQAAAGSDLEKVARRVRKFARRAGVDFAVVCVLAAVLSVMSGYMKSIAGAAIVFFVYAPLITRLLRTIPERADFSKSAKPEDYPELFDLIRRARDKADVRGELVVYFEYGGGCSIAKVGNTFVLSVGTLLFGALTGEELYNVFLHEFAHVNERYTPRGIPAWFLRFLEVDEVNFIDKWGTALLKIAFTNFAWEYVLYTVSAAQAIERGADSIARERGNAKIAGEALCKTGMFLAYNNEIDHGKWLGAEPFMESETPHPDQATRHYRGFLQAFPERRDVWMDDFRREIQPRNVSHPILRERLAALGVTLDEMELSLPEEDGSPLRQEFARALAATDEEIAASWDEESYKEARKTNYLDPLETIRKFEEGGCVYDPMDSRLIIRAYGDLCRYEEQEAFCDRVIAETENVYATVHARFTKGEVLLWRDDPTGLDYLWRAIEPNSNCTKAALELIGAYCCRAGLAEELDNYRRRAVELAQKQKDTSDQADSLCASDHLEAEHFPDDRLPSMLEFMKDAGEGRIWEIYLVRKVITEDFFSSVFVIRLDDGLDEEIADRVMDKIFRYLDTYPIDWQYSLFGYGPTEAAAVAKVKSSLVWSREDEPEETKQ